MAVDKGKKQGQDIVKPEHKSGTCPGDYDLIFPDECQKKNNQTK